MKQIQKDIKDHNFKPVYLLSGEEAYLTRQFFNLLKDAIAGEDTFNVNSFQGKAPDIKEIISLADTVPFFADSRLILIEDSGYFKNDAGDLVAYLPQMPETTHIVFREEQVDKRSKLYKVLKKIGYHAEIGRQSEADLERWVLRILKQNQIQITASNMHYLLSRIGTDMNTIKNELDKLISYLGDKKVLDRSDIDLMCSPQIEGHIFEMIDAMAEGKRKLAYARYEELMALREPALRILFLITRQYIQLCQVKEMQQDGMNPSQIAKEAGLNPYVAKKIAARASGFTMEDLKAKVAACASLDEKIKTGLVKDSIAVEMLITAFSH